MPVHSVTIYGGENPAFANNEEFLMEAALLGTVLAEKGVTLVCGGMKQGLMGAIADAALEAGGKVVGVIPEDFPKEKIHPHLTETHIVKDAYQRKQLMIRLSDASVTLPGGHGTASEFENELDLLKEIQKGYASAKKYGMKADRAIILLGNRYYKHYQAHYKNVGRLKKNGRDGKLYQSVDDFEGALTALGLRSPEEQADKYKYAGTYGTYFVSRDAIDAYRKPISEKQRKREMRMAAMEVSAGIGTLFFCQIVNMITTTNKLAGTIIGITQVLLVAGGILSALGGLERATQATSRPVFNPIRGAEKTPAVV